VKIAREIPEFERKVTVGLPHGMIGMGFLPSGINYPTPRILMTS
jgi:hypothetical protein